MRKLGPHSRPSKLQVCDGRRAEAKAMRAMCADLTKQVGGDPTTSQRILIERAAMIALQIQLMDRQSLEKGGLTERNGRQYLAWVNSLHKVMRTLGIKREMGRPPSIDEMLAGHAA